MSEPTEPADGQEGEPTVPSDEQGEEQTITEPATEPTEPDDRQEGEPTVPGDEQGEEQTITEPVSEPTEPADGQEGEPTKPGDEQGEDQTITEQATEPADGQEGEPTIPGDEQGEEQIITEPATEPEEAPVAYPAVTFSARASGVNVDVTADEGAFPEGTTMAVRRVWDSDTLSDIRESVADDFTRVRRVQAVDIAFYNIDGVEIEPLIPISVVISVSEINDGQSAMVVHMDDEGQTEVVTQSEAESAGGKTNLNMEMPAGEAVQTEAGDETDVQTPETDDTMPALEDGVDVPEADSAMPALEDVVVPEADTAMPALEDGVDVSPSEDVPAQNQTEVSFDADAFSLYAVVVTETISTHYIAANGDTYNIEVSYGPEAGIPSGATLFVSELPEGTEAYDSYVQMTAEALDKDAGQFAFAHAFDISVIDPATGEHCQPVKPVSVSIRLLKEDVSQANEINVVHFPENEVGHVMDAEVLEPEIVNGVVAFESDGFSVYVVTEDNKKPRVQYQFFDSMGGEYFSLQQTLALGEPLIKPTAPSDDGKVFVKWVAVEGPAQEVSAADEEFTGWGPVTFIERADTYPVIRYLKAVYETGKQEQVHITWHDQEDNIIRQDTVLAGTEFDPDVVDYTAVQMNDGDYLVFRYWTENLYKTDADGNPDRYPVAPAVARADADVNLYPYCSPAHWLYFDGNKAKNDPTRPTSVPYTSPILVLKGEIPQRAECTFKVNGFTFDGWWTQAVGGVMIYSSDGALVSQDTFEDAFYTGGDSLEYNPTLYAHWTQNKETTYSVVYYAMKKDVPADKTPDPETDYVVLKFEGTRPAETGAEVGCAPKDTVGYAFSDQQDQRGFELRVNNPTVIVKSDGTSTLKVYFDRKVQRMHFVDYAAFAGFRYPSVDALTRSYGGKTLNSRTITARYGSYIGDQFPVFKGVISGGQYLQTPTSTELKVSDDYKIDMTCNSWYDADGSTMPNGSSTEKAYLFKRIEYMPAFKPNGDGTSRYDEYYVHNAVPSFARYLYYYLEVLPGTQCKPDPVEINTNSSSSVNTKYVYNPTSSMVLYNGGSTQYPAREYTYELLGTPLGFGQGGVSIGNFQDIIGFTQQAYTPSGFGNNDDKNVYFFYTRNSYTVTLKCVLDREPTDENNTVEFLYEQEITDKDLPRFAHENTMNVRNDLNSYWFYDEACTDPVDFENFTMPAYDITLYEGLRTSYPVAVDPAGGVLDGKNGSTWFNVDKGEAISEYAVTRDYVAASELNQQLQPGEGYFYVYNSENHNDGYNALQYGIKPRTAMYIQATESETGDYINYPGYWAFQYWYQVTATFDFSTNTFAVDEQPTDEKTAYNFDNVVRGPVYLKAKWARAGSFSVVYDAGAARAPKDNRRYTDGAKAVVKASVDNPAGYQFRFWSTQQQPVDPNTQKYIYNSAEFPAENLIFRPNQSLTVSKELQADPTEKVIRLYAWYEEGGYPENHYADYRFYIPNATLGGNGKETWSDGVNDIPYYVQTISPGETLVMPKTPDDPVTGRGGTFIGWFLDKDYTERFEGFGVIGTPKNTELYACFAKIYTVKYHGVKDGDVDTIVTVQTYRAGEAIDTRQVQVTVTNDRFIAFWSTDKDDDPNKAQPDEGTTRVDYRSMGKKFGETDGCYNTDLELYPILANAYTLHFDSCGGSYVAPLEMPRKPRRWRPAPEEPVYEGYTFQGWFTAPDDRNTPEIEGIQYKFNMSLDDFKRENNLTAVPAILYAHWELDPNNPALSTVTVNIWVQNTARTGYTIWRTEQLNKPINSTINLATLQNSDGTEGYLLMTDMLEGYYTFADDKAKRLPDDRDYFKPGECYYVTIGPKTDEDGNYFNADGNQVDSPDAAEQVDVDNLGTSQTVKEDGSTKFNIYFDRRVYKLVFEPDRQYLDTEWVGTVRYFDIVNWYDGNNEVNYDKTTVTYSIDGGFVDNNLTTNTNGDYEIAEIWFGKDVSSEWLATEDIKPVQDSRDKGNDDTYAHLGISYETMNVWNSTYRCTTTTGSGFADTNNHADDISVPNYFDGERYQLDLWGLVFSTYEKTYGYRWYTPWEGNRDGSHIWGNAYYFKGWRLCEDTVNGNELVENAGKHTATMNSIGTSLDSKPLITSKQSNIDRTVLFTADPANDTITLVADYDKTDVYTETYTRGKPVTVHYIVVDAAGNEIEKYEYQQTIYDIASAANAGADWKPTDDELQDILNGRSSIEGYVYAHAEGEYHSEQIRKYYYNYALPADYAYTHRLGNLAGATFPDIYLNNNKTTSLTRVREGDYQLIYTYTLSGQVLGISHVHSDSDPVYLFDKDSGYYFGRSVRNERGVMSTADFRALIERDKQLTYEADGKTKEEADEDPYYYYFVSGGSCHVNLYFEAAPYKLTLKSAEDKDWKQVSDVNAGQVKFTTFLTNAAGDIGYIRDTWKVEAPFIAGKRFICWSKSKDAATPFEGTMPDYPLTLYAHYEDTNVTVTLRGVKADGTVNREEPEEEGGRKKPKTDANGVLLSWETESDNFSREKLYGTLLQAFELPTPVLEPNEEFHGWKRVLADGTLSTGYVSNTTQITEDSTLVPEIRYSKGGYVQYHANDGREGTDVLGQDGGYYIGGTVRAKPGTEDLTDEGAGLTRQKTVDGSAYDLYFVCWNTQEDGTGDDYYPGDTVLLPDADKTLELYAKYSDVRVITLVYHLGNDYATASEFLPCDGYQAPDVSTIPTGVGSETETVVKTPFTEYNKATNETDRYPNTELKASFDGSNPRRKFKVVSNSQGRFLGWSTDQGAFTPEVLDTDDIRVNTNGADGRGFIHLYPVWAICKVVDDDGVEHPFPTLNTAYQYIVDSGLTTAAIEMIEDYAMPASDALTLDQSGYDITLTTASSGEYVYPVENGVATIKRVSVGNGALFDVEENLILNAITLDGDGKENTQADGGGLILLKNDSTLEVGDGATLKNGLAKTGGAVSGKDGVTITVAEGATFDGNTGNIGGGAINVGKNANITITGGTFSNNIAHTGVNSNNSAAGGGGAINLTGNTSASGNSSTLTISNATFSGNKAIGFSDNGITEDKGAGGAIRACEATTVTLTDCSFTGNEAGKEGGAVAVLSKNGFTSSLTVNGCTFTRNVSSGNGGAIKIGGLGTLTVGDTAHVTFGGSDADKNTATQNGGAIIVEPGASATIADAAISYNEAANGGGVYVNGSNADNKRSSLTIQSDALLEHNSAGTFGSAVFVCDGCSMTMSGGEISNNNECSGGAVAIGGAGASMTFSGDAVVSGNTLNGEPRNIYLNYDGDGIINAAGLGSGANIGVYVENTAAADGATANQLFTDRGGVTDVFGSYTDTDGVNVDKFVNDRNDLTAVTKTTEGGNRLIWQQPIHVELRYVYALKNITTIDETSDDFMAKGYSTLYDGDFYLTEAPTDDILDIVAACEEQTKEDWRGSTDSMVFWRGYADGEQMINYYLAGMDSARLDEDSDYDPDQHTKAGKWIYWRNYNANRMPLVDKNGSEKKLIFYYTEPAFMTITNNSGVNMTEDNNVSILFSGEEKTAENMAQSNHRLYDLGIAQVVERNGVPVTGVEMLQNNGLCLNVDESIRIMIPGARGGLYYIHYTPAAYNGLQINVIRTGEDDITLEDPPAKTYPSINGYPDSVGYINQVDLYGGLYQETVLTFDRGVYMRLTIDKDWNGMTGKKAAFRLTQMKSANASLCHVKIYKYYKGYENNEVVLDTYIPGFPDTLNYKLNAQYTYFDLRWYNGDTSNYIASIGSGEPSATGATLLSPQNFGTRKEIEIYPATNNDASKYFVSAWFDDQQEPSSSGDSYTATGKVIDVVLPFDEGWERTVSLLQEDADGNAYGYSVVESETNPVNCAAVYKLNDTVVASPFVTATGRLEVSNTVIVCKLTDGNDNLLYKDAAHNEAAVYSTLEDGVTAAGGTLYTSESTTATPKTYSTTGAIKIKMLVESYDIRQTATINIPTGKAITLTTANNSDTPYPGPYTGARKTVCQINRGKSTKSMFTVPANANFTTENITFDGGAVFNNAGEQTGGYTLADDGGIIVSKKSENAMAGGALTVGQGTTMQNTAVGSNKCGGAVYAEGTVTVSGSSTVGRDSVVFENCYAAAQGGGIYTKQLQLSLSNAKFEYCTGNKGGASVYHNNTTHNDKNAATANTESRTELTNCLFEHGRAISAAQHETSGGIFSNTRSMIVAYCEFNDCKTRQQGGGLYHKPYGQDNTKGTVFQATNCTFKDCEAGYGQSSITNGFSGGAMETSAAMDTFIDCNYIDCTSLRNGGAFNIWNTNAEIEITRCNFVRCKVIGVTNKNDQCNGGAVRNTGKTTIITDSTFIDCSTRNGGGLSCNQGTTYIQGDTAFKGCTATNFGGGIYQQSGTLYLWPTTLVTIPSAATLGTTVGIGFGTMPTGVTAPTAKKMSGCSAPTGGGIYLDGSSSKLYLVSGTIDDCSTTTNGGGIYQNNGTLYLQGGTVSACRATGSGGGVYQNSGTLNFSSGSITGCTAKNNGGGVNLVNGTFDFTGGSISACEATANGGGIYLGGGKFKIESGLIDGCIAKAGGGVYINSTTDPINISRNGDVITNCKAAAVTTDSESGVKTYSYSSANLGGGIYQMVGDLNINNNAAIRGCEAYDGGGVYLAGDKGTLDLGEEGKTSGGILAGCTASHNGGGLFQNKGTLNIYAGSQVTDNTATNANGGGIHLGGGTMNIHDCEIKGNKAANGSGGGISVGGGTITITGGTIGGTSDADGNEAKRGAGLFLANGTIVNLYGGSITHNNAIDTANVGGGGIAIGDGGKVTNAKLQINGKIVVRYNTAYDPELNQYVDCNLLFDWDNSNSDATQREKVNVGVINATDTGLNKDSYIGVYVSGSLEDTNSLFFKHGNWGMPFGTFTENAAENLNRFINDRTNLYAYYYGVPHPGSTYIFWADYICKITDISHNLLFESQDGSAPALYRYVGKYGAFDALRKNTKFYNRDGTRQLTPVYVEMLVPEYDLAWEDSVQVPARAITLTTATPPGSGPSDYQASPTVAHVGYQGENGTYATIKRGACTASMFTMAEGTAQHLTLKDINIDGGAKYSDTGVYESGGGSVNGVMFNAKGKLTLDENATLQNAATSANGGVILYSGDGTLTVKKGAKIQRCKANNGGVIAVDAESGTVNIEANGGEVSQCAATNGGIVYVNSGTVNLNGTITNETGDTVLTVAQNTVENGGGAYVGGGTVNLNGVVKGLTATEKGGGAYVNGGKLQMPSTATGAAISGCSAKQGGGAYVNGGTFEIVNGSVTGNTATVGGGGVFVNGGATLTMNGNKVGSKQCAVTIKENKAEAEEGVATPAKGGGIAVGAPVGGVNATLNFSNKVIVTDNTMTVPVEGGTAKEVRCNVYLDRDSNDIINVKAALSADASIGVYTSDDAAVTTSTVDKKHGLSGLPFGKWDNSTNLKLIVNDRRPFLYGDTGEVSGTIYWVSFICKITDKDGKLLYRDAAHTLPAVYKQLAPGQYDYNKDDGKNNSDYAFGTLMATSPILYQEDSDVIYTGAYRIEMLVPTSPWTKYINVHKGKDITLTTALGSEDENLHDDFPYVGEADVPAQIVREANVANNQKTASMITLRGSLTLENIVLDGNNVDTVTDDGAIVQIKDEVNSNTATLTIGKGAQLINGKTTGNGGAVFVNREGQKVTIAAGTGTGEAATIKGNVAASGAGIYIGQNVTLELSGDIDFGGTDVYAAGDTLPEGKKIGDIKGTDGNFATGETLPAGSANGQSAYERVRQDIFMEGHSYEEKAANSIVVSGPITSAPGSIWVWVVEQEHFKMLKQFAVLDDDLFKTVTKTEGGTTVQETVMDADKMTSAQLTASLEAFRNARPNALTECSGDYLTGETGDDMEDINGKTWKCVYWSGITGERKVILRKVDSNYAVPDGDITFIIFKGNNETAYTPKGGTMLANLEVGPSGCFWIGKLPYGTYYLNESTGRWFYLIVDDSGVYCTLNPTSATTVVGGYDTRALAEAAATAMYEKIEASTTPSGGGA